MLARVTVGTARFRDAISQQEMALLLISTEWATSKNRHFCVMTFMRPLKSGYAGVAVFRFNNAL